MYLGEAATVLSHDVGVGAFQLLDDLKALVELREDVHHGAGEQGVLRRLLELGARRRGRRRGILYPAGAARSVLTPENKRTKTAERATNFFSAEKSSDRQLKKYGIKGSITKNT